MDAIQHQLVAILICPISSILVRLWSVKILQFFTQLFLQLQTNIHVYTEVLI